MLRIGRYEITGELGRGAMGVVYQALDPAIGRTVAIKSIRLAEFADPAEVSRLRERLLREAQSAGLLSHPGIVTIYDVAEQDGMAYVAMEFVNGPTLEQLLGAPIPPEPHNVLRILRETAAALDYAHKKGIVHRDIKPANIMIAEDGSAKITDFGVAKISASQQMTQAGTVIGTPSYMSPEQIEGKPVDGRSDQFSLAVIAYEMLTGEKPFSSEQIPSLLYKIVHEEPAPPHRINPTLGWQVEVVIRQALSKNPEERYSACADFVRAMEGACNSSKGWKPLPRGAGQDLPTSSVRAEETTSDAAPAEQSAVTAPEPPPPVRRWRFAVVLAVAAVLAGTAFLAWRRGWLQPSGAQPPPQQQAASLPQPASAGRPSPAGPPVDSARPEQAPPAAPSTTSVETPESQPAKEPAPAASIRIPPTPAPKSEPGAPSEVTVLIRTSPPGATVVFDRDSSISCKSPCSITLPPGRHTAAATLDGHRAALRIFEAPKEPDIFLYLARMTGQVQILSDPPGAAITVDGHSRPEVTPATLDLPVGKYTIAVVKAGYLEDQQEVEVRDSAFVRLNFRLARQQAEVK